MTIFDFVTEYWLFLTLVSGIAINWIRLEAKVSSLKERDSEQQKQIDLIVLRLEAFNPTLLQIEIKLASIQATLEGMIRSSKK